MEGGQSSGLSIWSLKFLKLSSQLNHCEWKSNQKQCSVLRSFFADTVVQYIKQWWCFLFAEETQSEWAAAVGWELVGVLERGIWLFKLCEMDWSTTSVIIPSGPAEFCDIVDDMKRYAKMMNMLIQTSPLDSDRRNVVLNLQNKIDSDASIMKRTLIWASNEDEKVLRQSFIEPNKLKRGQFAPHNSLKALFWKQLSAKPNIDDADLQRVKMLGRGGFGTVYKAKYFNLLVAVKEINPDSSSFNSELQLLMKLQAADSSHILQILGHSRDKDDRKQLVLELMDDNLANVIEQEKIGILQRIDIIIQIAKAMKHVHESNVIYRDMKPSNILVKQLNDRQWLVKLADFGISKVYSAEETHTYLRGTLRFMAPEMLDRNCGKYTIKVDVFSFGITCAEILTGIKSFSDIRLKDSGKDNMIECMKELLAQGERPKLPEGTPKRLKELLKCCWDQEASKRPYFAYILEELWHVKEELLACGYVSKRETDSREVGLLLSPSPSQSRISELTLEGSTRIGGMLTARLKLGLEEDCLIEWFREDRQGSLSTVKNTLLKGKGEHQHIEDEYQVTAYDVGSKISVKCFGVESTPLCAATHADEITGLEIVEQIRDPAGMEFRVKIDGGEFCSNHRLVFSKDCYQLVWGVYKHLREEFKSGAKIEADENHPLDCIVTPEKAKYRQKHRLTFKTMEERNQAVSAFAVMTRQRS